MGFVGTAAGEVATILSLMKSLMVVGTLRGRGLAPVEAPEGFGGVEGGAPERRRGVLWTRRPGSVAAAFRVPPVRPE